MADKPAVATPRRIQRQRTKGWRMPPNTVYVGRPSKWGNPYRVVVFVKAPHHCETPSEALDSFIEYVNKDERGWSLADEAKRELRGQNLACWCALDQPCHADVLLELANA